jgi:tetratricopeptide (TPR) repeat protein
VLRSKSLTSSRSRRRSEAPVPPSPARSRPGGHGPARSALSVLLILFAGFAAYSNSFAGVFVFDDEPALERSPNVRTLWPLGVSLSAPEGSTLSGRPVASLTFAIDYARSSWAMGAYHETNLTIHLLTALLLFGVVRRTLERSSADAFARAATPLALIVAVIFVVHPLQTSAVTYLVQRVESLMGLFFLAALYTAIRSLEAADGRARAFWAGASVVSCALGMATKEVMVAAPLVILLWDRHFASDRPVRKGFYLWLAATWFILGALVSTGPRTASVGFGFADWPWWRYLLTQAEVVTHYLRLSVVPSPLVLDYGWEPVASWTDVAAPAMFLAALMFATLWGLWRRHAAAFAAASCLLILAPSSSVLPIVTEVAAEHRMYLPLAGVISLLVLGVFAGGRALALRRPSLEKPLLGLGLALATGVALLFGRMTWARNLDYHDYDRIWSDTIEKRPRNARARNNYATSLLAQGRFAEAEAHLRVAVALKPEVADAQANLGVALASQGRAAEGIEPLATAVRLKPDAINARRNLAEAYAIEGRLGEAAFHYSVALESSPEDVHLLNRVAWILATAPETSVRNGSRARDLATRAVRLTGGRDIDSLDTLAAACAETGDFTAASRAARDAQALAGAQGLTDLAAEISSRGVLYAQGRPFRTPGGGP